jgi:hypothetical protein
MSGRDNDLEILTLAHRITVLQWQAETRCGSLRLIGREIENVMRLRTWIVGRAG